MPQQTVTIKCSFMLAKRLGALPCHPAELLERNSVLQSHRYFRVVPIYDPNSDHSYVYWKWEVVHPSSGGVFALP